MTPRPDPLSARLILKALDICKLVPAVAVAVLVGEEQSEDMHHIRFRDGRFKVTHSKDVSATPLFFADRAQLLTWVTTALPAVSAVQLESFGMHFEGEREIATLFLRPTGAVEKNVTET